MKKTSCLIFLSALLILQVQAQISITPVNWPMAGDTNIYAVDTILYPGFTGGTPGTNQVYDYSSLGNQYPDTIRYIDPQLTPYGSNYPLANLVRFDQDDSAMIYWKVDTSQIVAVGTVKDTYNTGNPLQYHYDPLRLNLTYPSTYNTYHPNTVSIHDITVAGSYVNQPYDSVREKSTNSRTIIFDGWGTLILPSGSYPCLRESRIDEEKDSIWTKTAPGGWVLLSHKSKNLPTIRYFTSISNDPMLRIKYNGSGQVKAAFYLINPAVISGLSEQTQKINFRVFPNPAGNDLYILHDFDEGAILTLFSATGQVVLEQPLTRNIHHVSAGQLSSGIYTCRVTDNNHQILHTTRVVINR